MICSAEFFTPLPGCEQTLSAVFQYMEQDRAITWNTSSTIYKASTNLTGCINSLAAFAAKDNSMELEGHPVYTSWTHVQSYRLHNLVQISILLKVETSKH